MNMKGRLEALEQERAALRRRLSVLDPSSGARRIDQARIASPCPASWDEMIGDDRVRFCAGCSKNVYNIAALSGDEVEELLQANEGQSVCARLYRREDGTVLTSDCPVGARRRRRRLVLYAAVSGAAMAAIPALAEEQPTPALAAAGLAAVAPTAPPPPHRPIDVVRPPPPPPPKHTGQPPKRGSYVAGMLSVPAAWKGL